jgi:hypothetical protein
MAAAAAAPGTRIEAARVGTGLVAAAASGICRPTDPIAARDQRAAAALRRPPFRRSSSGRDCGRGRVG